MTSRAQGTEFRDMVDCFAPSLSLLIKLGSIAVHADEALGEGGHQFDIEAMKPLLADREVQDWIASMTAKAFLPVKRSAPVTKAVRRKVK